jgi:hypothetical protein
MHSGPPQAHDGAGVLAEGGEEATAGARRPGERRRDEESGQSPWNAQEYDGSHQACP